VCVCVCMYGREKERACAHAQERGGMFVFVCEEILAALAQYRVATTHRIPYLYR